MAISDLLNNPLLLRILEVMDRRSENRMTEFGVLAQAFEFSKINRVSGDYFEFGVWRGKTFGYARLMAKRYGVDQCVFRAFDSFAGLPAVTDTANEVWSPGSFACSRSDFEAILRKKGFKAANYAIVEGFYDTSLTPQLQNELLAQGVQARIVYIDCDLESSTRDVLAFIQPFLQDGTILCFDDYFNYRGRADQGEQKAFNDFQSTCSDFVFEKYMPYSPLGMAFICNPTQAPAPD